MAPLAGLAGWGVGGGAFTTEPAAAKPVASAPLALADDTGCTFTIEPETHRELVVETEVKGRMLIWHKGSEWRSFVASAHDVEYFNLKRRHSDTSHFEVAVEAVGRKHQDEHLTWCQPV